MIRPALAALGPVAGHGGRRQCADGQVRAVHLSGPLDRTGEGNPIISGYYPDPLVTRYRDGMFHISVTPVGENTRIYRARYPRAVGDGSENGKMLRAHAMRILRGG